VKVKAEQRSKLDRNDTVTMPKPKVLSPFTGSWQIRYDNGAVREYVISPDGTVDFAEEKAKTTIKQKSESFVLDFGDGKLERLNITPDQTQLVVEHFATAADFPEKPQSRGVGTRKQD
jgi:hypothetical protein